MIFIKTVKFILKLLIFLISIVALYFLTAYFLTFFPTKQDKNSQQTEKIYIRYDDMHSDIVLNIKSINRELKRELNYLIKNRDGYLAFGWGDKETYLNTPTWNDIKISTSLKALFINTPSIMHISFYRDINRFRNIKIVKLSKEAKKRLEKSILKSFDLEKNRVYKGYGKNDLFYPSIYSYNMFNTCNTWTGDRLREANISISYWTPLSYNVIDSLP
ncbi:hypothetical protein MNB_SV-14-1787 [hydrothermal vent metagenome]|uniref:DUF2459 domain-containing protein n=1 Tax=hydrothermal vent metagenome TaxID=652676 RepID=A0A1W1CFS3_9ZZZZ